MMFMTARVDLKKILILLGIVILSSLLTARILRSIKPVEIIKAKE